MTGGRSRLSLDLVRAAVARLEGEAGGSANGAALVDAWGHAESALQQLAGTDALRGQDLLRELRSREYLTLREAHAIVDLGSLVEGAGAGQQVGSRELDAAREMFATIVAVLERRGPPAPAATATPVPGEAAATEPPPSAARPARSRWVAGVVAAVAVLALGGAAWWFTREPGELRRGRAAYAAGDRIGARNAFSAASGRHPTLAEPLLYLGRISREEGDLASAREHLRRAIALEPANPLGHRELAAVMLASGRPDLARAFYERAIRLDPTDRTAQGYMGCTLVRLGQYEVAQRFLARAGSGPWSGCAASPSALPAPPPR